MCTEDLPRTCSPGGGGSGRPRSDVLDWIADDVRDDQPDHGRSSSGRAGGEAAPLHPRESFPDLVDVPDGKAAPKEGSVGHAEVLERDGARLEHRRGPAGDEDEQEIVSA